MNSEETAGSDRFNQVIIYRTPDRKVKVEVYVRNDTIWLSQQKIADLFGVHRPAITKHLRNIFLSGELEESAVCSILEHTASDGKTYNVQFYNLDAIISVGYRVNSVQATSFRIWATERLKEYIIKGFTMDDERLKNPQMIFGQDFFEEQLARIRDIRSSERRFYQKITDIYSRCSADYQLDAQITKDFYATVQNKLHWAITGHTAAEIIAARADSSKPNMGLTHWRNSPSGMIRKKDVGVAKNYLNESELDQLNRIVGMYLDYAEMQANKGVVMYMKDWVDKLDSFLQFNEKAVLNNPGKIAHEVAISLANKQLDEYRVLMDKTFESDFDIEIKLQEINGTESS